MPSLREQQRITILGGLVLTILTLITGGVVFAIMLQQGESILSTSLHLSLQNRARLFQSNIENRANGVHTIATRPYLIQELNKINRDLNNPEARFSLQRAVKSFLSTGFTALAIYDADDREIARAGDFNTTPELNIPVKLSVASTLLWSGQLIFSGRAPIQHQGKTIGFVRAQAILPTLSNMLFDVATLGKTGELAVCAPVKHHMQCFPSRLHPKPFLSIPRVINSKPLPMDYALSGKSGVLTANDYRHTEVVAAYMPLDNTGLGLVLKVDGTELFQPILHQLLYVLPALGLLILLGILALRWLVTPLVKKLAISEYNMRLSITQLADEETRIRTIFENVDDGIVVMNTAGVIQAANPSVERIFGYQAGQVVGENVSLFMPESVQQQHDHYVEHYIQTGESNVIGNAREVTAVHRDGTVFPIDLRVTEMRLGDDHFFIGTMRDITDRKQTEQKIIHLATHDSLTNLPNRHLLTDRLQQAITHTQRHQGVRLGLLFIDLDGFKKINDLHGHDIGDLLLVEVASRIRGILRNEDTTARQGGDEFIVALPGLEQPDGAMEVAEKLLTALATPYCINDKVLEISASIGIAIYPDDGTTVEMLLKNSDIAMYSAKAAGRGICRRYQPE